ILTRYLQIDSFCRPSRSYRLFLMNHFRLLDIIFYPVESAEERLPHCDTDFAARSASWKTDGNNPTSYHIAFTKFSLRFLTDKRTMLLVKGDVVVHDLGDVKQGILRSDSHERSEISYFNYFALYDFVHLRVEGQELEVHFMVC